MEPTTNNASETSAKAKLTPEQFMEEARMAAAQCWCDESTKGKEMDATLAEAVAGRIAVWMCESARQMENVAYYQGLLDRIGKAIGERAFICDDGSVSGVVLRAKLPELVEALVVNDAQLMRQNFEATRDASVKAAKLHRVRAALAHMVGADTVEELVAMKSAVLAMMPEGEDRTKTIEAIEALIEVRP